MSQAQTARDQVFSQMLEDPANPRLMLDYARLSVAERDYEAAIGTLERLVDQDPTNQEARFELAAAYFALGQNEVAEYHLDIYRTRGDLTEQERRNAAQYAEAVENRQSGIRVFRQIEGGLIYYESDGDLGLTFGADLSVDADIGGAQVIRWDTDFEVDALVFPSSDADDLFSVRVRTGPVVPLNDEAFGAQLRPFLEFQIVETDDDADAGTSFAAGLGYSNVINANWTVSSELIAGSVDRTGTGIDSTYTAARVSLQYRLTQSTGISGSLRYLSEDEDAGGTDLERTGGGIGISHDVPGPFLGLGQSWAINAFGRVDNDEYDDGREDDATSYGVSIVTNLTNTTFLRAGVRQFDRSSNDPAFDEEDTVFSFEAGVEF